MVVLLFVSQLQGNMIVGVPKAQPTCRMCSISLELHQRPLRRHKWESVSLLDVLVVFDCSGGVGECEPGKSTTGSIVSPVTNYSCITVIYLCHVTSDN